MKEIKALPELPPREPEGHKGRYGRVHVVGGSHGLLGAPCLCGRAALRSGAGLCTVIVPRTWYSVVAAKLLNCTTLGLPDDEGCLDIAGDEETLEQLAAADVMALGPGLGRGPAALRSARYLYDCLPIPTVVDADALFALAQRSRPLCDPPAPRILTPHPGEMARLLEFDSAKQVQRDRPGAAMTAAKRYHATVVLKGHETYVTDGRQYCENTTGNPGMATGGAGDVLTGVIAALAAQGLPPFPAAQMGVYVHGLAGDVACDRYGEISMMASDILEALPEAFRSVAG